MAASIRFVHVTKRYLGGAERSPAVPTGRPEGERHSAQRDGERSNALDAASFDIAAGEFVYLTGHSGAGKSTVFRLLAAIERPSAGTVLVSGQNVGVLPAAAIPFYRRNLGLVLQDQRLLADRNVLDNVLLPLAVAGVAPRDAARRARAALDKVGLAGRERAQPVALSGGEQQRVLVARAVVNRPALLLADEPTANLDADTADVILALFRSFHDVGTTVVLATHDTALVARHPARRITLARGRVVGVAG